ncbi:MAG: hypothetical protein P8L44_22350 [Opitutales bacterium]|nr:hypothetical protein [Opitutales bacterium]
MKNPKKEFDWFDHKSSRKLLWWLLWITCGLTVVAELFIHRHPYFDIDGLFSFYAITGFIGCSLMILGAKGLGLILKRDENYYGEEEETSLPKDIDGDAQ